MTITDTIQRAIDSITAKFGGNEDEIYEEMMGDEREYPIVDNMAIQPEYMHQETTKQKNSFQKKKEKKDWKKKESYEKKRMNQKKNKSKLGKKPKKKDNFPN